MDDQLWKRVLISVMVMGWVVILYQIFFNASLAVFSYGKLGLAMVVGAALGGVTFGVLTAMKS